MNPAEPCADIQGRQVRIGKPKLKSLPLRYGLRYKTYIDAGVGALLKAASAMEQLTAEREVREDAVVVRFEGELDRAVRAAFESQLHHGLDVATGRPVRPLIIDLLGVTFFGSCSIAEMLQCHDAGAAQGVTITLVATDQVLRIIKLTGLDEIMAVHPTLDDALYAAVRSEA